MRIVVALAFVALGCGPIEPTECGKLDSEDRCHDAELEYGACIWVDVLEPKVVDGACVEDPPSHGACIGISGTQTGCGGFECASGGEVVNYFFREKGDHFEVFENPECGPTPESDDWMDCVGGPEPPPACTCACGA